MSFRLRSKSILGRLGSLPRPTPLRCALSRPYRSLHGPLASVATSHRSNRTSRRDGPAAALAQHPDSEPFASSSYIPPPPLSTPSSSDDAILRAHFDHPHPIATPDPFTPPSGLFLLKPLTIPSALGPLTDRTLIHGQYLVDRICRAPSDSSGQELRLVIKNLDRLSDLLCGVIDMCELVRNVHPDGKWVLESEKGYERLCSFMNELNTDRGLYEVGFSCPHVYG